MNMSRLFLNLYFVLLGLPVYVYIPSFTLLISDSYLFNSELSKGFLIPASLLPFLCLALINIQKIIKAFCMKSFFFSFNCLIVVLLVALSSGNSLVRSLQIVLAIFTLLLVPSMSHFFSYRSILLCLISSALFGIIHVFDHILTYGGIYLGAYTYPFVFGYHIYSAMVSFPDLLLLISSTGLMVSKYYISSSSTLRRLVFSLSIFLIFYSLSFARVSTAVSLFLSITFYFIYSFGRTALMNNCRLMLPTAKYRFVYPFILLAIFYLYDSFIVVVNGITGRIYSRIIVEQGSNRTIVWSQSISHFLSDMPTFLFGSPLHGAHNLLLDFLMRCGVIGVFFLLLAFYFSCVYLNTRIRPISNSYKLHHLFNSYGFCLGASTIISGNIINEALTQIPVILATFVFVITCYKSLLMLARVQHDII